MNDLLRRRILIPILDLLRQGITPESLSMQESRSPWIK